MPDTENLYFINPVGSKNQIPKVKAANLSQLTPNTYSTVRARVVVIKSKEKTDELGKRSYIFGICEDQSFRTPFICYKPYPYFYRNGVFDFEDTYVHQFEDKSLLLIVTERSSLNYLINEDPSKYSWNVKIGDIKRPMGVCRITLQGILSQISSSSGLVQRCETCGRVAFENHCPNGHEGKLFWAVRIAGRLSDRTGSINIVIPQQQTCKLLGRTVGEILQLTEGPANQSSEYTTESYTLQIPEGIEIGEAYADDPDEYRSAKSPVVVDLNDSRILYPNNLNPKESFGHEVKKIDPIKPEDRRDLTRVTEKLLEIKIRNLTNLPKINGVYLTEQPTNLYGTENAKLYAGFRLKTYITETNQIHVEALPSAEVYESVLDYVAYRRQRGASTNSIKNSILNYRRNVVFAPSGELAAVINLNFTKAGEFIVPIYNLTLPEFWHKVHDIEIAADEIPLIVTKSYRLDLELTFPPSCVYFDKQSLRISYGTRNFIDRKRQQTRTRTQEILTQALQDFSVGTFKLNTNGNVEKRTDARQLLLADIRERLVGKSVKATGSVIEAEKRLYFIPRTVEQVEC